MTNKKTEDFEILTPREHVIRRPGMYIGSTSIETVDRFVLGKWVTLKYVPALNKMVDEIIDNSIDEAIRTNFKYANEISVTVTGESITIEDNGRGIPQDKILDSATGESIVRPLAAWTRTNAGTNFGDDRTTIGANGVGSACTNFMSTKFIGTTWRDGKCIKVSSSDGALVNKVTTMSKEGSGTKVTFIPNFSLLAVDSISDLPTEEIINDRLTSLQIAFPEIKFKFNGKRIKETTIKKYAALFTGENETVVTYQTNDLSFFFASSEDGFRTTAYVNGVNTRQGGSYVDFVVNGVIDELIVMLKRKHKIDVPKSTIKSGLTFVTFARNFTNPKFDSQTKERLTNTPTEVKSHYTDSGIADFNAIAKKLMTADDIIEPIIAAQLAKKMAADKRLATLEQKKLKRINVAKHIAASSTQATLFLCEGDSALGFYLAVRDPVMTGAFPLRGVIMNTWDMKPVDVLKNKELGELIAVLGLDINDPDSVDNMVYQNIATLTDPDTDGYHISTLLIVFFYKFWPRLFHEGRVLMTRSPIMISTDGKKVDKWFYSNRDAKAFKSDPKNAGFRHRYIKGLASLTEQEYHKIINQPVFSKIEIDDPSWIQVMMGDSSTPRKEWLTGQVPDLVSAVGKQK